MLRLVAYAPDGVRRYPIHRAEMLIGSEPSCDVYLPYSGVSQAHARLRYDGQELKIEDLGSRRGVLVAGKRVRDAELALLDEVRLGTVTLLVEDVAAEKPAPEAAEPALPAEPRIEPEVMLEHLAAISTWVLADVESRTPLETLTKRLLADFGGGALFLLHGDLAADMGSKFVSATGAAWVSAGDELLDQVRRELAGHGELDSCAFWGTLGGEAAWIAYHAFVAVERPYGLIVALPRYGEASWQLGSSLRALGDLLVLGLVHHVGWYEPILPGRMALKDLVLDPALVVGESAAMKTAIEQLRLAIEPELVVLLRGQPGTGKELLARSLHLSSARKSGPLVIASCAGASPAVVEADLFGAELQGREGSLKRQGKLSLAHGGTLFLDDVEQLPIPLQARLVRFLRSGEVEPAGSKAVIQVDLRLIVGSAGPLEPLVAKDAMRVDLAYRLCQLAIDVPSLADRREDLPLLIQSAVNRACHDSGKRMQGITVKAMSALLAYDYPGNLAELTNLARQLVYLCPPGKPIDVSLLPGPVKLATIKAAARVDAASDLDLERLVAGTERSALREALRRTHGNKSQAARLLGLSRNGLAMKMEKHGVKA